MSVGSFDPSQLNADLELDLVRALLSRVGSGETLDLDAAEQARFAPLVTHAQWAQRADDFSDEELTVLIRVFTLGEQQYESWIAEQKSAVVPLVRALKARGRYDKALTRWIKQHSNNKFLPHGSLMDRL